MTSPSQRQPSTTCWLCGDAGGVALHEKWSAERGKPLWTAHEHPSPDSHQTRPCPVCRSAKDATTPESRPSATFEEALRSVARVARALTDETLAITVKSQRKRVDDLQAQLDRQRAECNVLVLEQQERANAAARKGSLRDGRPVQPDASARASPREHRAR